MLQKLPPGKARRIVDRAAKHPSSNPTVRYPSWYLHRWHFLPEGYLSRRSAAGYDRMVRNFYNGWGEHRTHTVVAGILADLRPQSVIDSGCGPGHLVTRLAASLPGTDIVGVDLSPYLLQRARKLARGSSVRFVHANGLALPAGEGEFDAGVATHFISHLPETLRAPALAELARVVRPGGHIVLVDHRWHAEPVNAGLKKVQESQLRDGLVTVRTFARIEGGA